MLDSRHSLERRFLEWAALVRSMSMGGAIAAISSCALSLLGVFFSENAENTKKPVTGSPKRARCAAARGLQQADDDGSVAAVANTFGRAATTW